MIFFGSTVKRGSDRASDIDLIVVMADITSDGQIEQLKQFLCHFEEEVGLRRRPKGLVSRLQRGLDRVGAQYKSMFVCRSDIVHINPGRIFSTDSHLDSVILDNSFLRNDIGFKNIVLTARTTYGEDLIGQLKTALSPIERGDFIKNLITFSLLNLYALLLYPFTKSAVKYGMSASKWAMHTCYFVETNRPGNLPEEVAYYAKRHKTPEKIMHLRSNYGKSFSFLIRNSYSLRHYFLGA